MNAVASETQRHRALFPVGRALHHDSTNGPGMGLAGEALLRAGQKSMKPLEPMARQGPAGQRGSLRRDQPAPRQGQGRPTVEVLRAAAKHCQLAAW